MARVRRAQLPGPHSLPLDSGAAAWLRELELRSAYGYEHDFPRAIEFAKTLKPGRLIDRVWGDRAPERARTTLYGYLHRLRKVFPPGCGAVIERRSGGYVLETLGAAFWAIAHSDSAEEAIVAAVSMGDDTDTTGAVTGALAGAHYGVGAIPARWLEVRCNFRWPTRWRMAQSFRSSGARVR